MSVDTLTFTTHDLPPQPRSEDTPYARLLVRVMRAVVGIIVAGFIVAGVGAGYGYAHRNDRSTEWVGGRCMSSLNADETCGYKPAAGNILLDSTVGGVLGLLGGMVASFGLEVSITLYMAGRKYLRS